MRILTRKILLITLKLNFTPDTLGSYGLKYRVGLFWQGSRIHQELRFNPPIAAYDQDRAIDAPLRYDIVTGNERRLFRLDTRNASLFLERELDLDTETALPGNTFILTVQASQMENPLRAAVARVEVELQDLNDNVPEFEVDLYNISIVENLPSGFSVLQVVASDRDQVRELFA